MHPVHGVTDCSCNGSVQKTMSRRDVVSCSHMVVVCLNALASTGIIKSYGTIVISACDTNAADSRTSIILKVVNADGRQKSLNRKNRSKVKERKKKRGQGSHPACLYLVQQIPCVPPELTKGAAMRATHSVLVRYDTLVYT